jgi:hypothetical protein
MSSLDGYGYDRMLTQNLDVERSDALSQVAVVALLHWPTRRRALLTFSKIVVP